MLVTFRTKAYSNITMFGDVAIKLLNLMGHSGTVPSAIRAEDVPAALERLKTAIAHEGELAPPAPPREDERGQEPPVSLATRALPLIELLESAIRHQHGVMWDGSGR
jgi:hypothetical protein